MCKYVKKKHKNGIYSVGGQLTVNSVSSFHCNIVTVTNYDCKNRQYYKFR